MFCRFCGKEIPEGGRFCVNCGRAVDVENAPRETSQPDTAYPSGQQESTSQPDTAYPSGQQESTSRPDTAYPGGQQGDTSRPDGQQAYTPVMPPMQVNPAQNYRMAWFKFIIYFQLFANMAIMLYNALHGFFGITYGDDAALIYAVCPGLKAVDVIYGIICLVFIAGAVFIRQSLAHYKKNAPVMYILFIAVVQVAGLIYTFASLIVINMSVPYAVESGIADVAANILGIVLGMAIFIPLNYVYFKKRKELFIN